MASERKVWCFLMEGLLGTRWDYTPPPGRVKPFLFSRPECFPLRATWRTMPEKIAVSDFSFAVSTGELRGLCRLAAPVYNRGP